MTGFVIPCIGKCNAGDFLTDRLTVVASDSSSKTLVLPIWAQLRHRLLQQYATESFLSLEPDQLVSLIGRIHENKKLPKELVDALTGALLAVK